MLFAKNSDRQVNEAQAVVSVPAMAHQPGAELFCTYIPIPQVTRTNAVLLCQPFWMWGAEMGANEHGVVIGNEGLHARVAAPTEPALIGMDLLRLALERSASASEAVDVITALLAVHGQGGNCGHLTPSYYNNSFLIADAQEAIILETVGREWLAEPVNGIRTLSNGYSIDRPAQASAGLGWLAHQIGPAEQATANAKLENCSQWIGKPGREHIGQAEARRARSTALLAASGDEVDVDQLMAILRDHGPSDNCEAWSPVNASHHTLCMHGGAGGRTAQTTGSLVSEIASENAVHWVTATAAPCLSIFKPVLVGDGLPEHGPPPGSRFDPANYWWRHEQLHRSALRGDYARLLDDICSERDALEADFRRRVHAVAGHPDVDRRRAVVDKCWGQAIATEERWRGLLTAARPYRDPDYDMAWAEKNRLAGLDLLMAED